MANTYSNRSLGAIQDWSAYITTADLTLGAVDQTLDMASADLPAKFIIHSIIVELDQEFDTAGGGATMAVEIGNVPDPDKVLGSTAIGHGDGAGEKTTAPGTYLPQLWKEALKVKFTGNANVDTYTEGTVHIRVQYSAVSALT